MEEPKGDGDCYYVALLLVADMSDESGHLLCHGTCTGNGPIEGIEFGHAWVEYGNVCIDKANGKNGVFEKSVYYEAGTVRDVRRYKPSEVRRMMRKHKHAGPWDEPAPSPLNAMFSAKR